MSDGNGERLGAMTLRRLVLSDSLLSSAVLLGVLFIISCFLALPGYISSKGRDQHGATTKLLAGFAGSLIFTGLATVIIGTVMWFFTLRERAAFETVWIDQNVATQAFLQDTLQCCGYWNATTAGLLNSATGFCSNIQNVTAVEPCVTPITGFADTLLNDIFSTVFGFMAVQLLLFLVTICVINDRHEEERFRRIDEKRGVRGGFV